MIPGYSNVTRLPRLGKIRLGEKRISQSGKEFPAALDHMNLEDVPWVAEALNVAVCHDDKSGKPVCKALNIVFPLDEEGVIFPQARKAYRQSGLFCHCSDGVTATRVRVEDKKDEQGEAFIEEQGLEVKVGEMFELPCPGDDCPYWTAKHCKPIGRLLFMIPSVPKLGVYEITTSSWNTMVNVNSYLAFVRALAGRIAMIPFKLALKPQEVQPQGKKKTVYVLDLTFEGSVDELMRMKAVGRARALPGAKIEVPSETELDKEIPDDIFPAAASAERAATPPAEPPPADLAQSARARLAKRGETPKARPPEPDKGAASFVDSVQTEEETPAANQQNDTAKAIESPLTKSKSPVPAPAAPKPAGTRNLWG